MTPLEAYLFLFFDSTTAALAFVPGSGMVYDLMTVFGGFNKLYIIIVAIVGNSIGSSLNYILGKVLRNVKQKTKKYSDSPKLKKLSHYANSKLFLLAIFSFASLFGVIITIAAGFLNVNYRKFLFAVIVGRIAYYCIPLII
jgi:membrane protein YqaA with SNARE-associated domain